MHYQETSKQVKYEQNLFYETSWKHQLFINHSKATFIRCTSVASNVIQATEKLAKITQ